MPARDTGSRGILNRFFDAIDSPPYPPSKLTAQGHDEDEKSNLLHLPRRTAKTVGKVRRHTRPPHPQPPTKKSPFFRAFLTEIFSVTYYVFFSDVSWMLTNTDSTPHQPKP